MRFTGQVRVPEVDHPGIPATIVVEDGLAEVLLEGESLGRWSLFDVHAARLVSSAFSISLDGEEITFIADEPVDFAYKGVEHMAGVWARYKSMTIPRRLVAVGRSRRGTTPSRIPELREAMLLNLQTAGRSPSFSAPAPAAPAEMPEPSPWAKRLDAYSSVPAPIDDRTEPLDEEMADLPEPVTAEPESAEPESAEPVTTEPESAEPVTTEPESAEPVRTEPESAEPVTTEPESAEPDPTKREDTSPAPAVSTDVEAIVDPGQSAPLRPGPGLIPRQVVRSPVEGPASLSEPPDWDTAWEEPPTHEEPYEALPSDAAFVFADDEPASDELSSGDHEVEATIEHPEPIEQPEDIERESPEVTADQASGPREVVLDLEDLEVEQPTPSPAPSAFHETTFEDMVEPDLELLFAGAPGPEGERSGLFGAVRSAFARNRGGSHEHQFVEAPGGIGIVRQICADCGYISIGVAE